GDDAGAGAEAGGGADEVDELVGELDVGELQGAADDLARAAGGGADHGGDAAVDGGPVEVAAHFLQALVVGEHGEWDASEGSEQAVGEDAGDGAVLADGEVFE